MGVELNDDVMSAVNVMEMVEEEEDEGDEVETEEKKEEGNTLPAISKHVPPAKRPKSKKLSVREMVRTWCL